MPESLEEYIAQQQEKVRLDALEKSRKRTVGIEPIEYYYPDGSPKFGLSCMYTALANYPNEVTNVPEGKKTRRIASNKEFYSKYQDLGWRKLKNSEEILPGDLVQAFESFPNAPYHALIYNGKNDENIDTYNYAGGGKNYNTNSTYLNKPFPHHAYRYVGTQNDIDRWKKEYRGLQNQYYIPLPLMPDFTQPVVTSYSPNLSNSVRQTLEQMIDNLPPLEKKRKRLPLKKKTKTETETNTNYNTEF